MKALLKIVTVVVLIASAVGRKPPKDREAKQGGITLKVLGQSGKISIRQDKPRKKSMVLEFDDLTEVDSSGSGVGCSSHFYRTFANTDFTFMPVDKPDTVDFQNISASYFNFSATLRSNSTLTAHMYIFKENGTYTVNDEEVSVLRGDVKMNIELEDWQFCGNGPGEDSNFKSGQAGKEICVKLSIKGKDEKHKPRKRKGGEKRKNGRRPNKKVQEYDLGDDMNLAISTKVVVDGKIMEMATAPSMSTQGSKSMMLIHFPKGKKVVYDPTFQVADPPDYTPDNSVATVVSSALVTVVSLVSTKLL